MQNSLTSVVLFTALFFTFLLLSKLGSVHLPLKYEVVYYGSLPSFCPPFATLAANMAFSSTVVTSFCKEGTFSCFFLRFLFCDYEARIYSLFSCGLRGGDRDLDRPACTSVGRSMAWLMNRWHLLRLCRLFRLVDW